MESATLADMQSAAKVGMLLVIFVVLVIGSFAVLGKSLLAPASDRYFADLPDAGGIGEGTPVLLAGVNIGTVSKVTLKTPKLASMTLEIKHETKIPTGSRVVIPTSFIGIGQNPVTIVPPDALTISYAPVGTTFSGGKGSPLDGILPNSKETIGELTRTVAAVRKLLEDDKLKERVSTLLASANQTFEKFGKLTESINLTLNQNQSNINRAISATTNAIQDVRRITFRVAQLMDEGKLQKNAEQILSQVQVIERHSDELVQNLSRLINDPKLRGPANEMAANVESITKTGKSIAANTEAMTRNGAEISKNGIEISKNVATISQKAIGLTDKANEIASNAVDIEQRLKGVLDKVGGFFSHTPNTGSFHLGSEIDLMRQSDPGIWRTDITFSNPLSDGMLYAGIYDAFEANKLIVQIGKPIKGGLGYRYGIYASKPGFGIDYVFAKRLSVRSDAWDINNPRLDLRAGYDFGNGFTGWVGVDRVFHANAPTIGIGIKR